MKIINQSKRISNLIPEYQELIKLIFGFMPKKVTNKVKVIIADKEDLEHPETGLPYHFAGNIWGNTWPNGDIMIAVPEKERDYPVNHSPFKKISTNFFNYREEFAYILLHESKHAYQFLVKDHRMPEYDAEKWASIMLPALKACGNFKD